MEINPLAKLFEQAEEKWTSTHGFEPQHQKQSRGVNLIGQNERWGSK
jgi:hypothetical protein